MKSEKKHFFLYTGLSLCLLLSLFLYGQLLSRGLLPPFCPFSFFAHLYCPGCGGTRALRFLLRGDIPAALAANPAVPALLLLFIYYGIAFFLAWRRGTRVRKWPAVLFAYLLIGYAVLRNLLLVFCGIDPLGDLIAFWR